MSQPNPLRAIIQRLVSTPVEDLPGIAYFLASSISRCLAAPQASAVDKSTLLHKLKARISSLLQDRTPEGRFAAVVVAKAVLEAGGREILVDSEPWIRGLIGILNKSDPAATKKLAILAVSRAFLLMQEYPSLIREITTPLLPSFNTACLAAIRPKTTKTEKGTQIILSPLLATAMQSWIELLPRHPVTFRPFVTRFRPICLSLLSDPASPASITEHAGVLLMALHHSASKNSAVLEWAQLIQDTVLAAHATATRILRSVREEWVPARSDIGQDPDSSHSEGGEPGGGPDALGLAEWKGVHDGTQRLLRLLSLLKTSLSVVTAAEVPVPLGDVMDLCTRLLSTTIPGVGKNSPYTLKTNSEFGKDERDTLWSVLPSVHVSCLKLLSRLVAALEHSIVSISKPILEHMTWVFGAEKYLPQIRETSYTLLALLLPTMGGFEAETDVQHVSDIIRYACQDVLHSEKPFEIPVGSATAARPTTLNVDSFVSPTKTVIEQTLLENQSTKLAAAELISRFLQYVPADLIPGALRTEVDRTAVLAQKPQALLASVLNPATVRPGQRVSASLMPFLAQSSAALEVEALLRPRMPVIIDKHSDGLSTGMAMAESDFEARVLAEAQPASTSLLDRLDEALTVPVRAVPVGDSDLEQREAAMPVTERILTTGNGTAPPAGKRDFHTMNGHGFSGGDMFDASKVLSADIKSKKIRMDHDSMAVSVWGDENLRNGKSSVDEQVETDASFRKPVSQVQETYVENGIDMQVGAQSDAKGVFNGKGPAHNADDSDSDIPEINIEPDTDEEDDDDMYD